MIEAMACGTPIIAFKRGSVPEVIEDGVSGFVVENEAEALSAIARLKELDRSRVREAFERRFTARRMAEDYGKNYAEAAPWLQRQRAHFSRRVRSARLSPRGIVSKEIASASMLHKILMHN